MVIDCVFEHIAKYTCDTELHVLLELEDLKKYYKLYNRNYNINNTNVIQDCHKLVLSSGTNSFIEKLNYFPDIFTLELNRTLCDLTQFTYLQELYLINCELNCKDLNFEFKFLQKLNFTNTISNFYNFLDNFNRINFPQLKSLELVNANITSKKKLNKLMDKLYEIETLTELNLSKNNFSNDIEVELFSDYNNLKKLQSIKLSNCNLTSTTIVLLNSINFTSLKTLNLSYNRNLLFDDDTCIFFIEFITVMSLEELNISGTDVSGTVAFIICKILQKSLKNFRLSDCHINYFYKNKFEENFKKIYFSKKNCNSCCDACFNICL